MGILNSRCYLLFSSRLVVNLVLEELVCLIQMAVAEPASREEHSHATFRTIGGILLIAFLAASVGFYVHTTSASSEDNPRDMMSGYVVSVRNT